MKDPIRLLDDESDPLRSAILRSGVDSRARAVSKERVGRALGLAAGLAGAASTGKALGSAGKVATLGIKAWIGLAALALAIGAVAVGPYLRSSLSVSAVPSARLETAQPSSVQSGEGAASTVTAASSTGNEPPIVDVSSLPRAASKSATTTKSGPSMASPPAPSKVPPPAASDPSVALAEQISALDDARRSLAAGDGRGALVELDAFDHRFPASTLAREATVVRVEALLAAGERGAATSLAQRFLAANPDSPYADHVRSLVGGRAP